MFWERRKVSSKYVFFTGKNLCSCCKHALHTYNNCTHTSVANHIYREIISFARHSSTSYINGRVVLIGINEERFIHYRRYLRIATTLRSKKAHRDGGRRNRIHETEQKSPNHGMVEEFIPRYPYIAFH